jgi:hypothetical protein
MTARVLIRPKVAAGSAGSRAIQLRAVISVDCHELFDGLDGESLVFLESHQLAQGLNDLVRIVAALDDKDAHLRKFLPGLDYHHAALPDRLNLVLSEILCRPNIPLNEMRFIVEQLDQVFASRGRLAEPGDRVTPGREKARPRAPG